MEISSVNFIHLLDLTRSSCEKCNYRSLWQESNLRPCDTGEHSLSYRVQLSRSNHKFMYKYRGDVDVRNIFIKPHFDSCQRAEVENFFFFLGTWVKG